jgi:hypothetical protein
MLDPKIFELLGINPELLANRPPDIIRRYLLSYRRTFAAAFHPDICPEEDTTKMLQTVNAFVDDVRDATPEDLGRLVRDAVSQRESTGTYESLYQESRSKVEQLNSEVRQLRTELSGMYRTVAAVQILRKKLHCLAV